MDKVGVGGTLLWAILWAALGIGCHGADAANHAIVAPPTGGTDDSAEVRAPESALEAAEITPSAGGGEPRGPRPDPSVLAAGRTRLLPGPEGFLSTWALLARARRPLSTEAEAALLEGGEPPSAGGEESTETATWIGGDEGRMELSEFVRPGDRTVYLGATLIAGEPTRLHLMVGLRGALRIYLDGELAVEADSQEHFTADHTLARLQLSEGEHRLVIRFDKSERGRWRGAVRVLAEDLQPGFGHVAGVLTGSDSDFDPEQLRADAVEVEETLLLLAGVPTLRARLHFPGGGIEGLPNASLGDTEVVWSSGSEEGLHGEEVIEDLPLRGLARANVQVRLGNRRIRLGRGRQGDRRLLEAAASLESDLERTEASEEATVDWRRREAMRAVREHEGDGRWRQWLLSESARIHRALERGRPTIDPRQPYQRMAFRSRLDDSPQLYELFVPPAYRRAAAAATEGETRRWPLVITLHGYKGNAGDYFRNTFGLARDWEGGETLLDHGRHGQAPTRGPMFVLAPTGRGQAFYRHAGEVDVLEALADVQHRFPIDPRRIYITGGSMGGTGAAYLPYRHPDLFAASAALAGYHDQRVRQDTQHESLSETERFMQAHRSDIDWAESGLHLPTLLIRGTRDRPLAWTRRLVSRLDELGYPHEHREPDAGHNVWTEAYGNGAIFRHFSQYRLPEAPRHVRLRTARERTLSAYWVRIDRRLSATQFADIDARISDSRVTLSVEGVTGLTLSPPERLLPQGTALEVEIEGTVLRGQSPLSMHRSDDGQWHLGQSPEGPGRKRAGVSGPIRDVYHERLVFVVGTQDRRHTLINRLVAEHWAHPKGWIVDYPIVDDSAVTEAMIAEATLVLIGPPSSNSILASMSAELPIEVGTDAIVVGGTRHHGPQVGTIFVAPNPRAPEHSLLVIAGPQPLGTWRSIALPDILPDFVVYDERVAPARGQWACGGTGCEYRDHGFFDLEFRLTDQHGPLLDAAGDDAGDDAGGS